jgi:phage shock protein C
VNRRLYRSSTERVLGGVAGGVADYFDLDPALVRVAWAVLILASAGVFLLLYLVMWFVVPEAPSGFAYSQWPSAPIPGDEPMSSTTEPSAGAPGSESADAAGTASGAGAPPPASIAHEWAGRRAERRRHRSGSGGIVIGSVLILIGAWFLAQEYVPWLRTAQLWPIALVLLGVVLLVGAMGRRSD